MKTVIFSTACALLIAASVGDSSEPRVVLQAFLTADFHADRLGRAEFAVGSSLGWKGGATGCDVSPEEEFDLDVDPFYVASSYEVVDFNEVDDHFEGRVMFHVLGETSLLCQPQVFRGDRLLVLRPEVLEWTFKVTKVAGEWKVHAPPKPFVSTVAVRTAIDDELASLQRAQLSDPASERAEIIQCVEGEQRWIEAIMAELQSARDVSSNARCRDLHEWPVETSAAGVTPVQPLVTR
jgi:hypothetical protein